MSDLKNRERCKFQSEFEFPSMNYDDTPKSNIYVFQNIMNLHLKERLRSSFFYNNRGHYYVALFWTGFQNYMILIVIVDSQFHQNIPFYFAER